MSYKKIALLIGSSAMVSIGVVGAQSSGQVFVPAATYLSASAFVDPYQFFTSLQSENSELLPVDDPIQVPVVKLVRFKFAKPEEMKFSI